MSLCEVGFGRDRGVRGGSGTQVLCKYYKGLCALRRPRLSAILTLGGARRVTAKLQSLGQDGKSMRVEVCDHGGSLRPDGILEANVDAATSLANVQTASPSAISERESQERSDIK
ncbi:hypothetical protein DFH07DRAFT_769278 [Mycena maculata]|uniref:Uncharacterized protein n=1 Tax=Mycena maculata TaxID=230809 RepID=A0AAD7JMI8_9AGAR|nr:hypothetical protein DFH07DRAFT_769278 [Mycena maculata]